MGWIAMACWERGTKCASPRRQPVAGAGRDAASRAHPSDRGNGHFCGNAPRSPQRDTTAAPSLRDTHRAARQGDAFPVKAWSSRFLHLMQGLGLCTVRPDCLAPTKHRAAGYRRCIPRMYVVGAGLAFDARIGVMRGSPWNASPLPNTAPRARAMHSQNVRGRCGSRI